MISKLIFKTSYCLIRSPIQLVGEHNLNANDGERAVRVKLTHVYNVIYAALMKMMMIDKSLIDDHGDADV